MGAADRLRCAGEPGRGQQCAEQCTVDRRPLRHRRGRDRARQAPLPRPMAELQHPTGERSGRDAAPARRLHQGRAARGRGGLARAQAQTFDLCLRVRGLSGEQTAHQFQGGVRAGRRGQVSDPLIGEPIDAGLRGAAQADEARASIGVRVQMEHGRKQDPGQPAPVALVAERIGGVGRRAAGDFDPRQRGQQTRPQRRRRVRPVGRWRSGQVAPHLDHGEISPEVGSEQGAHSADIHGRDPNL